MSRRSELAACRAEARMRAQLICSVVLFALFVLLLITVQCVDLQPIGPEGSTVGFASLNGAIRDRIGQNEAWYAVSEVFGYLAFLPALGFAVQGLIQLLRRRSLRGVDMDIYLLAALYVATGAFYLLFEAWVINYRPVLEEGVLAASFPSSHTLLSLTLLGSAAVRFGRGIAPREWRCAAVALTLLSAALVVLGRLLSGVHWFTDILGGLLLGGALIVLYAWGDARARAMRR